MNRKTPILLLVLIIIASLILAACTTEPAAEATQAAAPTEAVAPVEKKVVTLIWTQEFDTLSPLYSNMWFVSVVYPAYLCSAWLFDDQNTAFPYLVTEIPSTENGGISNEGRTITLNLRDDIVWSD